MEFVSTGFQGLFTVKNIVAEDNRGAFIKKYHLDDFSNSGIDFSLREQYYSISQKDVVRGMHFQAPPFDHSKLVYVISGSVLDVVIDLRKDLPTYGKCFAQILTGNDNTSLFIPTGFAHGFKSLEDNTIMLYNVSSVYNRENDFGIRWDSIGFNWEVENPILSSRDKSFPTFDEFVSPF